MFHNNGLKIPICQYTWPLDAPRFLLLLTTVPIHIDS